MTKAIVIMGVSGSGKTSVGKMLADTLDWTFFDGDDFHPTVNVEKMASGHPLNDDDRFPWLKRLRDLMTEENAKGDSVVVACSALKKSYRDILKETNPNLKIVFLDGTFELIETRMTKRDAHFMKAGMLKSQFETLERPINAIPINIDQSIEKLINEIIKSIEIT